MKNQNPLVDLDDHYQTLHNLSCVVSYLQEVKHESELTDDLEHGRWLLLSAIGDALEFEKKRALEKRWR